jgi:hypothetical protein
VEPSKALHAGCLLGVLEGWGAARHISSRKGSDVEVCASAYGTLLVRETQSSVGPPAHQMQLASHVAGRRRTNGEGRWEHLVRDGGILERAVTPRAQPHGLHFFWRH